MKERELETTGERDAIRDSPGERDDRGRQGSGQNQGARENQREGSG